MKKLCLSMLVVMLLVTGCGKVPKLQDGKEAVVSIKDKEGISVDDLYTKMKNRYALSVLIDMIDEKILADKYPETDEEKKYVSDMKEQEKLYYDYIYSQQYSTYQSYLQAKYGVSNEEQLNEVLSLSYKRSKAIEDYAKEIVTDSEINKYYEEKTVGNIEASHILITADYAEGATEDEIKAAEDKALEQAKEIIAKLNNGEDFAELAKQYSKDGSASKGGALGEFNEGDMVQEFFDAAVALKVGEYSKEPVKTEFGYHIILKTAQKEKPAKEEVEDKIRETISKEKLEEDEQIGNKALVDLRDKMGISIEDKDLKDQYENYVYNVTK